MTKHTIVLVGFEPDWEALYIENVKVAEGHHVTPAELVQHTAAHMGARGGCTCSDGDERGREVELETTHVEEDEADEYGEHEIPEFLAGPKLSLECSAPKAFARISA